MARTVKLSRIDDVLESLTYPIERESAAGKLRDVTLLLANGEENLGTVVASVGSDSFDSAGDFRDELFEYLPEAAIGEPGQSVR
jgi:hypothetical protein